MKTQLLFAESHAALPPEPNTTPLIDVLLVLLVLLILTLPIITHRTALNLPNGKAAAIPPPTIYLDIDRDGAMYWNDQLVTSIEALEQRLAQLQRDAPTSALRITADRRTRYAIVAKSLAATQRARLERVALNPIQD